MFKTLAYGASAAALAALAPVAAVHAQSTTAQLRGTVVNASGQPVSGATVTILHEPTGSVSVATTSANGSYFESGLRPGGPYTVTVSAPGREGERAEGLRLNTGEVNTFNAALSGAAASDVIVVTGSAIQRQLGLNSGVGSVFSSEDIAAQPSIQRDIISSLISDPFVISTELSGRDRANGTISIAGQPPRFNGFVIDGLAVQNDFGLDQGAFPTLRQPISNDWIEEASVQASDYSVMTGGFTGGLINVVTKSGSNEIDGGAYYYYRDDSFVGDSAFDRTITTNAFEETEYGLYASGPIIEDRLFFFVGYEEYENVEPLNFDFGTVDPQVFDIIRNVMIDTYNYDPQAKDDTSADEANEKWIARLDWDINDDHRLTVSYNTAEDSLLTNIGTFAFPSNYYVLSSQLDQYRGELVSNWTDNFSTIFRVSRKEYVRGQDSLGEDSAAGVSFGAFAIETDPGDPFWAANGLDGNALLGGRDREFELGPDVFRHQNFFEDERTTFYGQGDYVLGDHVITFGGQYDQYELFNIFGQFSRGEYVFNSIADLENQTPLTVNYINATTNDSNDTAAEWGYDEVNLFVQDAWQLTPSLNVNFGARWTYYMQDDQPTAPLQQINAADPDQLLDFQDIYGFSGTDNLDGLSLLQPRFGFDYTPTDRLSFTGGVGVYQGGNPQVWVSNNFTPPTIASFFQVFFPSGVTGRDVPQALQDLIAQGVTPATLDAAANERADNALQNVDVLDPSFDVPHVLRASLQADYNLNLERFGLGDDYRLSASVLYGDQLQSIVWKNLAFERADLQGLVGVAPDGRPIYPDLQAVPDPFAPSVSDREFSVPDAFMITTDEGGTSLAFALSAAKDYENGFGFQVSYTYQDVEDLLEFTSSRAVSSWRGTIAPDRNNVDVSRSSQDIEHSFRVRLSYERDFLADLTSQLTVFGTIRSGQPFSYGYDVDNRPTRATFGHANGGSPRTAADPLWIPNPGDGTVYFETAQDETNFDALVTARGLEGYRGSILPRNLDDSPWNQLWNLRFSQELPGIPGAERFVGDNRFRFIVDVENFLNLLNEDWGTQYRRSGGFGRADIADLDFVQLDANGDPIRDASGDLVLLSNTEIGSTCQAASDCAYVYSDVPTVADFDSDEVNENLNDSVWRIRIGLSYEF